MATDLDSIVIDLNKIGIKINTDNKHIIRFIDTKRAQIIECPLCETDCYDIIDLDSHLHVDHTEKELSEIGNVRSFLSPVHRLREMYQTHQITDADYISKGAFFGKKIISGFNQHVLVSIIGKTGTGKSSAAMDLAIAVSEYVADHKGGNPEDYFNIGNVAIMQLDSILPLIEELDKKKYNIIILDDIGASYGARDFNDVVNKSLNKVFQVFRDTNTMVILTMPDNFLIDKVMRKLAHYQIEMTEQYFNFNISIGKLFELVEQYHQGKTHHHYIKDGKNRILYRYIKFHRPANHIADEYEEKRTKIRQSLMKEALDTIKESRESKEKEPTMPKFMTLVPKIIEKLEENPDINKSELGRILGADRSTIRKAFEHIKKYESGGRLADL